MKKRRVRTDTKAWKSKKRFPRFAPPPKVKWTERVLRATYNKLARARNFRLQRFNWDIYKTKRAWKHRIDFMQLAYVLVDANINPVLYLKIMSRFGRYKSTEYMPTPTWLSKSEQFKRFEWFYRSEQKSYALKLDFKKAISGWSDLDIYTSVRDSARMARDVAESQGWKMRDAIFILWDELSPWFTEAYMRRSDEFEDFFKVDDLVRTHPRIRHVVRQALKRSGV